MKTRVFMLVCLLGLAGPRMAAALGGDDQVALADGLFARGLYDMAVREYLLALEAATNHPRADEINFRIAESYRQLHNKIAAEKFYWTVELNYPASPYRFRAALRRAEMLQDDHKTDEVLDILNATLEAHPPRELAATAWYMLGSTQQAAGRPEPAAKAFAQIMSDFRDTPYYSYAVLSLAGLAAAETNGLGRAIELYRTAATNAASPRLGAEAWFQLAGLYARAKAYPQSADAYAQLARLYPDDARAAEARLPRAWSVFYAGMAADALKLADDALAGADGAGAAAADWLYLKANAQRQLLQYPEAARTYAALLTQFPQSRLAADAQYERTLALYKGGALREAIEAAQALLKAPAHRKDLYWLLAEAHAALKEEDHAIQYYRLLVEQFPDSNLAADASYRLAHLLQQRGDVLPAAELFEKLAQGQTNREVGAQAQFAAAVCLAQAGQHEQALRDWTALLRQYPHSALAEEALFQKAMSETYLHRDDAAIATLRELIARDAAGRFVTDARFWLGILLDANGRSEDAETELRQALAAKPPVELQRRVQLQLALVLQKNGKFEESANLLRDLLATPVRERMTPALLEWLAEYQLDRHQPADAVGTATRLAERGDASNVWHQVAWGLMGRGLMELGKDGEARAALEQAVSAEPGTTETRANAALHLGELERRGTNYTAAIKRFDEAANLAADDSLLGVRVRAYAGIARTLEAQGDAAGAARYFMSVAVLFDDPELVPECLAAAARMFKQLGKHDESAKALQELAQRYPNSPLNKKGAP